ncbi:glioma pathogenesis-related protein 1 isoform X1 [Pogona vitticeps]
MVFRKRMTFRFLCGIWMVLDLFISSYTYDHTLLPDIEDEKFIKDCVNHHNYFRSSVNPSSSNMLQMTWDPALAKTARAWAKKCHFGHNVYLKIPRKVHPYFTPVGENIWTGSASHFSVEEALRMWYDEVHAYNFESQTCAKVCGHYTQVVWATSYKVGCAVQFCPRVSGYEELSNGAHFICNYGPAGNFPTKPYRTGRPCSGCNGEKCVRDLCGKYAYHIYEANPERDQLISYSNWSPDWDETESSPKAPSYPGPYSTCDSYCIAVLILRLLFVSLTAGTVAVLFRKYPQMFMYE